MEKEKIVDELIAYFMSEDERLKRFEIPKNYEEKRRFLRGVINIREPKEIESSILELEDKLLSLELKEKNITNIEDIVAIDRKICVWQGDITTLKIDAIVDACNNTLLGCFIPNHSCIDNQIHTYAGIRLRLECNSIMKGKREVIGNARITKAYNLPCKYVIHTVGPMVLHNLTEKEENELASSYKSCLDIARKNNVRSIAFPSISTGVFHFPKDKASIIALNTVREYLKKYPQAFDKIVFNVYTKEDREYYDRLFKN